MQPHAQEVPLLFGAYVDDRLLQRYDIRPRARELYTSLIKRHLKPAFGRVPLTDITSAALHRSSDASG